MVVFVILVLVPQVIVSKEQKQWWEVFYKIHALKNFTTFTGKDLWWSPLFSNTRNLWTAASVTISYLIKTKNVWLLNINLYLTSLSTPICDSKEWGSKSMKEVYPNKLSTMSALVNNRKKIWFVMKSYCIKSKYFPYHKTVIAKQPCL